ncbi:MAG: amidohydrolase family protein [Thermoanaerobaculia bacterium]
MTRLLFLLLFALPTLAETIEWKRGLWFDGTRFREATFYTADGKLTKRKPAHVDRSVDLAGKYVVPPFGDAHHHGIDSAPQLDAKIRAFLDAGVFYVKNPNVIPDLLTPDVRAKLNVPASIDVAFANGGLTRTGGHPGPLHVMLAKQNIFPGLTAADMPDRAYFNVDTIEQLDAKWPRILAGKPDFLKTFVLEGEGLTKEVLNEIVKRAHAAGLRVSSHIETASDFRIAVDAGVDEINHLPMPRGEDVSRFVIDEETAKLAAKKGVTVVTTQRPIHMPGAPGPGLRHIENAKLNVATLRKAGVMVALGSDGISGEQPFATARDEALFLHEHGFADNLTLLKMWSENTPRTIFPKRRIGHLAEGYDASFLVLEGDPLHDFANVTKIAFRVKQGSVL